MIKSSCLCGTVRWGVGAVERMTHCHCGMCRKAHGAPFATYASAPRESFQWLAGEDAVRRYESSPGFLRAFCPTCGSVVPEDIGETMYLPAGCFDDDPEVTPSSHIFVAHKAPWHPIEDHLTRYDAYPEGEPSPVVEREAPPPGEPGVLRGSCLCGAVAYEVHTPVKAVHNCHCSRCRKARSAAHATNGFTPMDGVRFVRGEDNLVTYKLPEARFFTHVFCATCGSGMPRLDPGRGIAVIPFGSLDDDPGREADDHIFVGSKAPWYTIAGDLPQFEEMPG